ncbi:uncharacterized protein LOC103508782 isoform X4 [Diaphorina citri]|uniref:Uncharacterized protein LOC103508782 isoform X4 n=1 Tax=Diaphorina citri TaxID=121845 RepID=A0A1S3D0J0_DIACI|nr:uncharacterized protein LOC103508782 isoform X4 [Diaphorina citri]
MTNTLSRLTCLFCLLVWGCSSDPAPHHTGAFHPEPMTPSPEEESIEEEITHSQARKYNGTWCPSMSPQKSMDIDQLMGIWHVVEIILHRENSKSNKPPKAPPIQQVEGCPTIHLNRNPTQGDILSLLWNEEAGFLEYRFQMTNLADLGPGYWVSYGPQNGSLSLLPRFKHFAGTVIVVKAVHMELILTFCSPTGQFFTVLLHRLLPASPAQIISAHALIKRRGLDVYMYKQTCRSGAHKHIACVKILVSLLLFIGVMRRC